MTLELGIHLAWFARYQNQPFFAKISQISHFWVVDTFAPGLFCNLHIFADDFREYQPIQEKRIDYATSCPTIEVVTQMHIIYHTHYQVSTNDFPRYCSLKKLLDAKCKSFENFEPKTQF